MNHKRIIREIKLQLIRAEYQLNKGRQANCESHLYRIYNYIHFGRAWLTPKQNKHKPSGKLKK